MASPYEEDPGMGNDDWMRVGMAGRVAPSPPRRSSRGVRRSSHDRPKKPRSSSRDRRHRRHSHRDDDHHHHRRHHRRHGRSERHRSSSRHRSHKHRKKDRRTREERIRDLYKDGFVPSPTFLPSFSPKYLCLDAYIEITARRGSGKTTLFKEIMRERAHEFALVIIFSSTEKVNSSFHSHNPGAFIRNKMDLNMIDNLLKLRSEQIEELQLLISELEKIGYTHTQRYKEAVARLAHRRKQYVCLFFDDMTSDRKLLNNKTFTELRNMGRHYGVCVIINKQSDQNTERSQRNQADTSILFNTSDSNELQRAWSTQFRDMRLFPTLQDFERAHQKYCDPEKRGCLVHISRFDHRVPSYIKSRYHTFAYNTQNYSAKKIGNFASQRVRLYNDAVYVPHKLLAMYAQTKQQSRDLYTQLESLGAVGGVPRSLDAPGAPPKAGGAARDKGGADDANADVIGEPTPTRDGKVRIQTDPTGERFWKKGAVNHHKSGTTRRGRKK